MDAPGFMSYGPRLATLYWDAARQVDAILRGAQPAAMPIELLRFELVLNTNTARTLGISLSRVLMERADAMVGE